MFIVASKSKYFAIVVVHGILESSSTVSAQLTLRPQQRLILFLVLSCAVSSFPQRVFGSLQRNA